MELTGETTATAQKVDDQAFIDATTTVVKDLHRKGDVVIIGRGANVILADTPGVTHVGLLAPLDVRVEYMIGREHLDRDEAQGYVEDPARFRDPADGAAVVMQVDDASRFDDFAIPQNCSYDSQIMIGGGQRLSQHPLKVVYADSNPIFDDAGFSAEDAVDLNSTVHRRLSGQNVLRSDGSAHWADSPNAGVQNDNIWQIGGPALNSGADWPQLATDSFMIP